MIALLIVASIISKRMQAGLNWQAGTAEPDEGVEQRRRVRAELEALRARDPNFSGILLDDFLYALYAQAHTLRGGGGSSNSRPISNRRRARPWDRWEPCARCAPIIVGAMRYLSASGATGAAPV